MVNKIALGTVQFGLRYGISNQRGQTPIEEIKSILRYCRSVGIEVLDTASAYGDSESNLGNAGVEDFHVISKFLNNRAQQDSENQLNNTLTRLNKKKLYAYLAHRPEELLTNEWEWDFLNWKKEEKIIEKIGFSLETPQQLEVLLNAGFWPDIIQVPYNYLDRRFEKQIEYLSNKGVEIHCRSAFLQGLFFMPPNSLPSFFDPIKPFLTSLQRSAPDLNGSLLKFVLEKKFISKIVMGVESLAQLQNNLNSATDAATLNTEIPDFEEEIIIPAKWPK